MSSMKNSKALVLFTEPTAPAHLRPVFGRLMATKEGVLFFPFGAVRKYTESEFDEDTMPGSEGAMSPEEEERTINNNARTFLAQAKTFTPQILFRGFTPDSGGGDRRLNGEHGVIPHGFLDGKALGDMWDTFELADMISDHLDDDPDVISDFSSWTQVWATALHFSDHPDDPEGRIAVLDTASMEENIWHTGDLRRANMADKQFDDEYLAYGRVTGPKYHCVSPRDLYNTTRIGDLLSKTPAIFGEDPGSCAIERGAVLSAMKVAAFLQPPSGRGETLAVLTARFVSYRAARISQPDGRRVLSYVDLERYLYYVGYQIQCLAMHAQDGEVILVGDTMSAVTRYLAFEVQLLQAVERAVAIKAYQLRTTMWEICRLRHLDELAQENAVGRTEDDDERATAMVYLLIRAGGNE